MHAVTHEHMHTYTHTNTHTHTHTHTHSPLVLRFSSVHLSWSLNHNTYKWTVVRVATLCSKLALDSLMPQFLLPSQPKVRGRGKEGSAELQCYSTVKCHRPSSYASSPTYPLQTLNTTLHTLISLHHCYWANFEQIVSQHMWLTHSMMLSLITLLCIVVIVPCPHSCVSC